MIDWTEERIARLKMLWAAGLSCSAIAADLGKKEFSRNAVIGKVHRLGLPGRVSPNIAQPKLRSSPAPARKIPRARIAPIYPMRPPPPAPALPSGPRPHSRYEVTLLERRDNQCAFIVGAIAGPATLMCGTPKAYSDDKCAYCETHARLAFTAAAVGRLIQSPPPTALAS